jgi:hypothetical protein
MLTWAFCISLGNKAVMNSITNITRFRDLVPFQPGFEIVFWIRMMILLDIMVHLRMVHVLSGHHICHAIILAVQWITVGTVR